MNIYIWKRLDNVTESYHHEGGLAIVARNLDHAKEVLKERIGGYPEDLPNLDVPPDAVYTLANEEETRVFIFPDRGCC